MFEAGKILHTDMDDEITIIEHLGSGGQGDVYKVEYKGEQKALKWYTKLPSNPEAFYMNLQRNVASGSPDKCFLWPIAVTQKEEEAFGYVMDLRPDGYHDLSAYMLTRVRFASFEAAVSACLRIVSAFRILHNRGLSYQDLNDGNFFIEPTNGDVRICDNDNVAPNGTDTGIIGKPRYMAPEVVLHKSKPDEKTDRFSLAVILFLILCMNHPLEGKKSLVPCMTPKEAEKIYGSEALFICDEEDRSNAPVKNIHGNVIKRWTYMPDYIKAVFLKAFSQEVINDPNKRVRELDWLKVLVRFRSDIVQCSCGSEVFIKEARSTQCDSCRRTISVDHVIKLPDYPITARPGSIVFRCQLDACNADDALTPVFRVVAKSNDAAALGILNRTTMVLNAQTPSGKQKLVQPKEVVPFRKGIVLEAYGKAIELI